MRLNVDCTPLPAHCCSVSRAVSDTCQGCGNAGTASSTAWPAAVAATLSLASAAEATVNRWQSPSAAAVAPAASQAGTSHHLCSCVTEYATTQAIQWPAPHRAFPRARVGAYEVRRAEEIHVCHGTHSWSDSGQLCTCSAAGLGAHTALVPRIVATLPLSNPCPHLLICICRPLQTYPVPGAQLAPAETVSLCCCCCAGHWICSLLAMCVLCGAAAGGQPEALVPRTPPLPMLRHLQLCREPTHLSSARSLLSRCTGMVQLRRTKNKPAAANRACGAGGHVLPSSDGPISGMCAGRLI